MTFSHPVESRTGGLLFIGPAAQRTYEVTPEDRFLGMLPALDEPGTTFQLVLNWFEDLKAKSK